MSQAPKQNLTIIAFPPCTDICSSGARWFPQKRADGRQQKAIDFFMMFVNCDCKKVGIENPIGIMSTLYRKPDQIIHPWMFGHPESKATCLWLKGLPPLMASLVHTEKYGCIWREPPSPDRWKNRSRTYQGIAQAMAEQWGKG